MNRRSICLYLNRKGLSAQVIHDEFVQVLEADAIAYSAVTSYLRLSKWRAKNEERHSDLPPDVTDDVVRRALNQGPFASMRELAKSTCILTTTVWRRLTGSLGFVVKYLHWVPAA
jgi:hypothetical protein